MQRFIIFSDLDGTLLDAHSYSFEPARAVLERLKERNIPLILCSSKTRSEMEFWIDRLELNGPFIVENGSAIVFPTAGWLSAERSGRCIGEGRVMELGKPHHEIVAALKKLSEQCRIRVRGLSGMSPEEVMEETGLSMEQARKAQSRDYSEPFLIDERTTLERLERFIMMAKHEGFNYTRGGRFHHLMGQTDKGKAVRHLTRMAKKQREDIQTLGLGDSSNDVPMLLEVDIPILVQRPDGTYAEHPSELKTMPAPGVGPAGWAAAIERWLQGGLRIGDRRFPY